MSENTIKRLLVVDDEEGPRQSLNMIFGDDYDVTIATSGEEAIEFSRDRSFHVVVTDIRMRGVSGIDVLREVKRIDPHTEVVVLTAYETLETARQAISLGASEYLKKPFDLDHIQTVVEECFRNYFFKSKQETVIREDVNAAKNNFLEIVSHELNTPMHGILGFLELLEGTQLDEEQSDYVATIRACGVKYFEHVQDILTYAKMSMTESDISRGAFNPATLVLKLIAESEVPESLQVISNIPDDLLELVSGAEQEIRIVVRKLLLNAFKFTTEGHVAVSVRYDPLAGDQARLTFVVADTGEGIQPELLEHGKIFDAFTQGDSSVRRSHEGLGLGLSLCKSIADRLGGTIRVESERGKGSTFTFDCIVDTNFT
ncbi:ATP-binding protein [Coraliomargarita algicola]|uniref:histidine kinase n=1 Tax=Coraliomargarita algicola TaxID=3092156 RepID=A0ABZ0RKA8_9BACT|nr:ATP-binding protein [Coraliomargarita sp. J2-16]WPJ95518.1 ATP-binding protein [Coraliomargarita sp. J2-16]